MSLEESSVTEAVVRQTVWRNRGHAGWWAFAMHRLSGVALAIFLPVHFFFLGRALNGAAALDAALAWTEQPLVKASEVALVFLLAVHLTGGLRLLAVEFGGWRASWQPTLIGAAGGAAAAVALLFVLNLG
jgi:fumarate reductase subunit D